MKHTRRFLAFLAAVALCLTVTASFAESRPKLTMMFSAGGSGNALKSSAERFGEQNGVDVEVLLFSISEVYEKQVLALYGKVGTPDLIAMDDTWFPLMKEYLAPLEFDEAFNNAFIPSMRESWMAGQVQYGVPVRMGGEVIVYRKDVLEAAGIDPMSLTTWEAVYAAAQKLTDADAGVYGWVGGYNEAAYLVAIWLNIMSSYGVDIFNEDQTGFAFNTEMGVKGTQMFVDLTARCATPGILSYGYSEEIEALQNGSAVMGQLWSARYASVDKEGLEHYGRYDVLPFYPYGEDSGLQTGVDRVNGWGIGINKYSENQELAKEFLAFVGSYEEQLRLAVEMSNSPVCSGIFQEESYLAVAPVAANMESAMANGIARPQHILWAEIEASISLYLQRAVIGENTAAEALEQAEKACLEILGQ